MANQGRVFPKGVFGMTQREREILIASVSWTDKSLTVNEEKAFQAGAKWADKTMIDKACECIIKLHNWPIQYEEFAKFQEEFIKEFRKAMED